MRDVILNEFLRELIDIELTNQLPTGSVLNSEIADWLSKRLDKLASDIQYHENGPWIDIQKVLDIINNPNWKWTRNLACKYIHLNIDTRNCKCQLFNRNGEVLSLEDLARQNTKWS